MAFLGRTAGAAPLTSADIPDDSITAAKIVDGAVDFQNELGFLENASATQNLSGTYSTERMYLNDSYTLTGDVTVTGHLALGTVADADVVITQDGTERTLTGSGTLESGDLLSRQTDLTGMTGELGSAVTGSPALNLGSFTGDLPVGVTGGSGLKNMTLHSSTWYIPATYTPAATEAIIVGWEESNAQGYNRLGTAPTENSDVFTMPATGWYWVTLTTLTYQVSISSDTYSAHIQLSTDSGSSFDAVVISGHRHITDTAAEQTRSTTIQSIVKITNTGTDLIRLYGGGIKIANTQIAGGTQNTIGAAYATTTTFTKLADI